MTRLQILALVAGTHPMAPDPELVSIPADGITALAVRMKPAAIVLPQTRKQAAQSAAWRQRLLEAAMTLGTILPVRPGVVLTEEQIPPLIRGNRPLIDQLEKRLRGQVQFQVSVSWDAKGVLAHFREAPELSSLFQRERISADLLRDAVYRLATRLADDFERVLQPVSCELIRLPGDEDMIFNAVLLTAADAEASLDKAVEAIDGIWTEGFRIRQIGPAPASSFALLDPQAVGEAEVALARARFELDGDCTVDEIVVARRASLQQSPETADEIRRSADILTAAALVGSCRDLRICGVLSDDMAARTIQREVA